jgi:membrane protease YdiL (CAAX protease family)
MSNGRGEPDRRSGQKESDHGDGRQMTDQDPLAEDHAQRGGPAEPPDGPDAARPHHYQPVGPQPTRPRPAPRQYDPAVRELWPGQWRRTENRQQPGQWQAPGPLPQGPQPQWSWGRSLGGVLVGFAPETLLTLGAYATGTATGGSPTQVSIGTGIVLLVSSLVLYGWQLFAAWMFSLRGVARALWHLGYRRPTAAYFWAVPLVLVVSYAVIVANDALLHPPQQDIVQSFPRSGAGIVMFTLLAVVMAPLAEETFFRGFVFRGFAESWGFFPGATVSGAVFSLAHLQLTLFVPLFVLGFGLAWAYRRTGSLWTNITLHAIFNGISVLAWALS